MKKKEEEERENERLKKIEWLAELDKQKREYYSTERGNLRDGSLIMFHKTKTAASKKHL